MVLARPSFRSTVVAAAAGGALIAGAGLSGWAGAQQERPTPTSCAGLTFTDPPGDQSLQTQGQSTRQRTPDNTDLREGFFRYAPDSSGNNVMTANIQVTNLTKAVQTGSTGTGWYFYFGATRAGAAVTLFVRANLSTAGAVTYDYGILSAGNTKEGDTTGRFLEGADGIIEIVVPIDKMQIGGQTLNSPYADAKISFANFVPTADLGPDGRNGKSFKVVPCAEPGSPTQPAPVPPSGGGGSGGGGPGGGGGTGGGGGQGSPTGTGAATLGLKVVTGRSGATKAARKKSFTVSLIASEKVTGLKARLFKGTATKGKTLGKGALRQVAKRAKLKVKVRKLKKGTHTLVISGKNSKAQTATVAVQLRLR